MKKNITYVGTKINGLKIIDYRCTTGSSRRSYFKCLCICGQIFEARAEAIKNGHTKSCGCRTSELMSVSHTLNEDVVASNILYGRYLHTAKRKDISFLLSIDDFKSFIFNNCYYCGAPPRLAKVSGSKKWNIKDKFVSYNGIDRIDNNIGYIIDNCVTCCSFCNGAKSNYSLEDFQNWIKRLVSFVNGKNNTNDQKV